MLAAAFEANPALLRPDRGEVLTGALTKAGPARTTVVKASAKRKKVKKSKKRRDPWAQLDKALNLVEKQLGT